MTTTSDPLAIADPTRLMADLHHLATLIDTSHEGYTRQALTDLDLAGRKWVQAQMQEAGLEAVIDGAGNVIGVLRGSAPGAGCIMTGSHTDTVLGGGRYDGNVGVAAALECVRSLRDHGARLRHDLVVVDFFSEEPNRFGISCVGSRAMTGRLAIEDFERVDGDGVRFGEALRASGFDPDAMLRARFDMASVRAFVELHVEQGPHLEDQGSQIGLVTSITGIKRFQLAFTGQADHAGTTPMDRRKDAGCAAAGSVLAIERIASSNVDGRGTTGLVTFAPDAVNVVTEKAHLWGEFRSPDLQWLDDAAARFESAAGDEASARSVDLELDWLPSEEPAVMDDRLIGACAEVADRLGLRQSRLYSGAEHDAAMIAKVVPTAMIFVPSHGGRSHCPEEFTADADVQAGADVLLNTLLTIDTQPGIARLSA